MGPTKVTKAASQKKAEKGLLYSSPEFKTSEVSIMWPRKEDQHMIPFVQGPLGHWTNKFQGSV